MLSKKAFFLVGILVIALCAVFIIPFSNMEGFDNKLSDSINATLPVPVKPTVDSSGGNAHVDSATVNNNAPITDNAELLRVVTAALNGIRDANADQKVIMNIQSRIAGLQTENAKTLVAEMGNPKNVNAEKAGTFLEYIRWYASNYPIDK